MPGSVVSLKDVHLTLQSRAGAVDILRGVSFDIGTGESVAIVGPSGSGKTSLLMIIAGLEQATRGDVRVTDRDFSELSEDELARVRGEHIGIVFQSFHLVPTMTALENVALPLEFSNRDDAFLKAEALLSDVGLAHRLHHFPAQLSGGEQQRVAVARALAPDPMLMLADEPTGNLDGRTGQEVIDLMFDLQQKRNATFILITHDASLTSRCDRVVRIDDGRIANVESRRDTELAAT